ncbi:MAG: peptide ABC transporter substrate-binding protein [Candidatus Dormibacteraeota bacterium]|nr:peptide ABC transporter substrate-binding protein [Candidatus Dormibacteraeota bacterium]MBV9524546.1 peptide ABC transporter substrate-binding protein [Candidatus Dormibacteraeota bacterium]
MTSRKAWRSKGLLSVVALAGTLLAAACGGGGGTSNKTKATFAELPGSAPNYILPLAKLQYFSVANLTQFQFLMYRPLYWFGKDGTVQLNDSLSLANAPQYSADGKSVTITLKNYKWSDGTPVTSRDVEFWQNLVTANKANWAGYSPGEYPDNVVSTTVNSPTSITFNLSQAYGSYFFTYNELSQVSPLPQHVWDKTSASGAVGDYDKTSDGAQAVYKFLDQEAMSVGTYNTNPLWQVVDGPWKLKSIDTTGNVKFVPNPQYSGPVKPKLAEFDEVPFTAESAEFNLLKGGPNQPNSVDYGYIPYSDAMQKTQITNLGYRFEPWTGWEVSYFPENFTNPTSGPIFSQLYFRQAMQLLVDQSTYINKAYNGYSYPTYGPVPVRPTSSFVSSFEKSNPYPFNVNAAVALLQQHGWTVNPGGVDTCTSPGTAPNQCGQGIAAGAQASFHLEYANGQASFDQMMTQFKTDFSKAGIQINLSSNTFNTVIGNAIPCQAGKPCTWDMEFWGVWVYSPDYYPTGDLLWATGAGSNSNGYSDPNADQLISATETSNSLQAMYQYEDYLAKNLPVVWMPTPYLQLSAINSNLQGVDPQDPLANLYPENWSWSS